MYKIFIFLIALVSSGCSINSSIMFKTPRDFTYVTSLGTSIEYKLAPNDIIEFRIYTNDGFKLIDVTGSAISSSIIMIPYLVEKDGNVKLPMLGRVQLRGLTPREAEKVLEDQYTFFYNKPFVTIKVLNKRVTVFTGTGGTGTVVTLQNENTTLIEALAQAGGITGTGKANKIKLIRGSLQNPEVQLVDLSTIEGMKKGNLVVQANDIIYVEPIPRLSTGLINEITPLVAIITSFVIVYDVISRIGK